MYVVFSSCSAPPLLFICNGLFTLTSLSPSLSPPLPSHSPSLINPFTALLICVFTGWYNDHHFHYGYFLFAAAALSKADTHASSSSSSFFSSVSSLFSFFTNGASDASNSETDISNDAGTAQHTAALEAILRDVCNIDATDPQFPLVRHKDFFDGHSWASGLFQQANGKGQESSSEVKDIAVKEQLKAAYSRVE